MDNKKRKPTIVVKDITRFNELKQIEALLHRDYDDKIPVSIYNQYLKVISIPEIKAKFIDIFKNKLDRDEIVIKNIGSIQEVKNLETIIVNKYQGKMPLEMYNSFLKNITNPNIKSHFVRTFQLKVENKSKIKDNNKTNHTKNDNLIKKQSKPDITKTSGRILFTVKPSEFSFQHTLEGPRLIYKNHKIFFMGKREWFDASVLNSIDRTFQIYVSSYSGANFYPLSDKHEFEKLLETKYLELKAQIDKEEVDDCFSLVDEFLIEREKDFLNSFREIKIKTYLNNYKFLKRKQVFEYKFNVLDYLQLPQTIRITIPLSSIIKHVREEGYERFNNIVSEKWKNGYVKTFDITKVFPNLSKTATSIIIPKIFIDRFGNDKPIEIKVIYSEIEGKFNSKLNSYIKGYNYKTEPCEVVFSDKIKISLRNILRNVHERFIITYYTSYIRMFAEGDPIIQENYESEIAKFYEEKRTWPYAFSDEDKFKSGFEGLQRFDKNNTNDWMWLTEQLRNGEIKEAFSFRDLDKFDSDDYFTYKPTVKVYLAIKEKIYSANYKSLIVSMYALDSSKSIYRFVVDKEKAYEAIFFIWSYFSSYNSNKRLDFALTFRQLRNFGIQQFYKDKPLEYRSGIGYCERDWLKE